MPGPGRIDTHQHVVPPEYRDWLADHDITAGGLPIPEWSAQAARDFMGSHGISTGILSVSTPGVHLGDNAEARTWARKVNEFVADVVRERPDSFGLFATLTLPDVDGALAEAAYAFDELDADGVVLLANVAGTYLGDPSFEPLFAELGRRGAVIFVHPAELPAPAVPGIPPFAVDFLLDTTRAALSLIASGTLRRHPRLKVILSHGGGFLPYAADRVSAIAPLAPALASAAELLREFYFDVALSSGPSALPSLLGFADPTRITYGSDYPYAPAEIAAGFGHSYERYPIDADLRGAIDRGNAETLFPRLTSVQP
jgi:predicted TIM-barrel fold metal-dependent hydrolase